jgi:localization factor PodJL
MTKSTPKTSALKRAAAKKPEAPKSVKVKATKAVKKPVRAATRKKIASPAKTKTTLKASAARNSAPKKAAPSKATKDDLRKTIASLDSRMKRANTLTRKSVKALESAVMTLDARTRKDNSASKAALTRKVNQLSAKLTEMVEHTQAEVNSELKSALNNPTVENLRATLLRADQRLSQAEQAQATAISKINRHLASMAVAVEARIDEEATARKAAITALKTETQNDHEALSTRIDTIEADTARALAGAGDKIAELSGELTHRSEASEISIREKVSEIALQTQTEFETYRSSLERRIEDISFVQSDHDTQRLEQSIAGLTARLEGLEYTVATLPKAAPFEDNTLQTETEELVVPQLSLVPSQPASHVSQPQPQSLAPQQPDAFTQVAQTATMPVADMPNPYLTGQVNTAPIESAPHPQEQGAGPIEFDPRNYVANQHGIVPTPPPPLPLQDPVRDFSQPELMSNSIPPAEAHPVGMPPLATLDQAIPYADPAYAEADPTMDRVRIGGEKTPKFNAPKLTGRNLRVAALATGVAVVGLVAAKGVFGGNDMPTPNLPQQTAQNSLPAPEKIAPAIAPTPDTSGETIGNYADNKAVAVQPSSDAAKTLNSAAAAGDSVAQFQLGLSYLEQGRTDEGVSLIRKSANQNQPAAQYRLAKLYEIGEGVTQDSEMARQLTERAARNGNRIAMHDLALYYAEGRGGVQTDLPTAANWFEKAAERGVVDSQFNLGVLFESGQGLPQNMTDAYVWYSIAAGQGDQFAKTRLEVLKGQLNETDLANADSRAKTFKPVKIDDAANGIFRNVAWAKTNDTDNKTKKVSQVREAQTMLTELGYEIGGADGSVGPKTRAAIMSFERSNSLPETGRVNAALIDRLELATGA